MSSRPRKPERRSPLRRRNGAWIAASALVLVGEGRWRDDPPDKLPIGIEKQDTSRFVFLYAVNRRISVDFRQFLIRHHTLFLNLHTWTVRLLLPRRFRKAVAFYKAALREELWTPLDPSVSKALETYFRERNERGGHLGDPSDRFIAKEFKRQGVARIVTFLECIVLRTVRRQRRRSPGLVSPGLV